MAFISHWLKPGVMHVRWVVDTNLESVRESIASHDRLINEHGGPYRTLHESPDGVPRLGAAERRLIADWLEREERGNHAQCRGVAFATESAIVRGMITAVLWFGERHYPMRVFSTRREATSWLAELPG
ncbi:MAG: hypothetical protein AB7K71_01975 [Polyangiaceae bacterium]